MAVVNGLSPGYSDVVVLDQYFVDNLTNNKKLFTTYIKVGTAGNGNLVFENSLGQPQFVQGVTAGDVIINAGRILTSATVRGVSRTTGTSNMTWFASTAY